MKPNTYVIFQRALTDAIMLSVSEVFDFPHQSGDSYQ